MLKNLDEARNAIVGDAEVVLFWTLCEAGLRRLAVRLAGPGGGEVRLTREELRAATPSVRIVVDHVTGALVLHVAAAEPTDRADARAPSAEAPR